MVRCMKILSEQPRWHCQCFFCYYYGCSDGGINLAESRICTTHHNRKFPKFVVWNHKKQIIVEQITVNTTVKAPAKKVWELWTNPDHIIKWNSPSPDWHTPRAMNDLQGGGRFTFRMEAKDGSMGFDFGGTYDKVVPQKEISFTMDDGRKAVVRFEENKGSTEISESFDPENENSHDQQRQGWQAIMDCFKAYAEQN